MTENAAELTLMAFAYVGVALAMTSRAVVDGRVEAAPGRSRYWLTADLEMRLLGCLAGIALVGVPVIDATVPWFEFADSRFRTAIAWLGVGLATGALWVLWRSAQDLGRGVPQGRDAPLEIGIYRFIRHPLYTALLLWVLAQFALSQNWLSGLLATLTFLAMYWLRLPRDEQSLLEQFGHRYLDYMERTGTLLPRWPEYRR